jgi:hypothetical protein
MLSSDAEKFRTMLIEKVYPEFSKYMEESEMERLALNLGVDSETCWRKFAGKKRSPAIPGNHSYNHTQSHIFLNFHFFVFIEF